MAESDFKTGHIQWFDNGKMIKEINTKTDVYCQGKKKNGQPCRRYLGRVEGKAELLCPVCKTWNVVEGGKVEIKVE